MANSNLSTKSEGIFQPAWLDHVPEQPKKDAKQAWTEQYALITALCDEEEPEEDLADENAPESNDKGLHPEGKGSSELSNETQLGRVKEMKTNDDLEIALGYLAAAHDANPEKPVPPDAIVKAAQLLSIMDDCVYLRDYEAEEEARAIMAPLAEKLKAAKESPTPQPLDDFTMGEMARAAKKLDRVTQKIEQVASEMGLKYMPLCNFSSNGKLFRNGPYCGAFYRGNSGDTNKDLIVLAFKGTGTWGERITDGKFFKKPAQGSSPLRGNCHIGFFDGVYKEFLSELSSNNTITVTLPFQLLRNQLWRLAEGIQERQHNARKTPVWVTGHSLGGAYATHCWQGLLATSRVNPHTKNRTIRDLFTFGSPRVGDNDYASYPNDIRDFQRSWRFVNGNDLIAKLPPHVMGYRHMDTKIQISTKSIKLGNSELGSRPESTETSAQRSEPRPEGGKLGTEAHKLEKYWESLRKGKVVDPHKWPLGPREESNPTRPISESLAIWSLESDHKHKYTESIVHPDHSLEGPESVSPNDCRHEARFEDWDDGGRYRSVVKIQSMFGPEDSPTWTMGTGWLIREDLVVTAGHNVFSKTYKGQAKRIKCWIGYSGRIHVNDEEVQHRKALNIVTTGTWYSQQGECRLRDVALIQVSVPFRGDLRLFSYRETPQMVREGMMEVVGYPGDKSDPENPNDIGAVMYVGNRRTTYDIGRTKDHMIEHMIDTYGGQSGAPIILTPSGRGSGPTVIGTHCYGGGPGAPNSGNPIGGSFGNHLETFIASLEGSEQKHPTPVAGFTPQFKFPQGYSDPSGDEESFWSVFEKVAKVGSVVLPSAGSFLGPVGMLLGTVAGGVLGSIAESAQDTEAFPVPDEKSLESCIQRAQLAEATLQSVIRLGRSAPSNEVYLKMQRIWDENHFLQIPLLGNFINPVLTDYGLLITADHWEKKVEPNPEARRLLDDSVALEQSGGSEAGHPNAAFVEALFKAKTRRVDGIPKDGEESLAQWLAPLMEKAIILAKPLASKVAKQALDAVFKRLKSDGAESLPTADEQDKSFQTIIQRAIMADCALQAVETLSEKQLEQLLLTPSDAGAEEGIIDSIKTRAQKIGPVALKYAKAAIKKYLPVLLDELKKTLDPKVKAWSSARKFAANFALDHEYDPSQLSGFEEHDHNPDSPVVEPRSPESPINDLNPQLSEKGALEI